MTSLSEVASFVTDANTVPKVAMVDPGNFVTYYNDALCSSLVRINTDVNLFTSEFSYAKRTTRAFEHGVYFQRTKWLVSKNRVLRSLFKLALYPVGHLIVLIQMIKSDCNVLHLQWSRVPPIDIVFVAVAKLLGIRVVFTVHDVEPLYRWSGGRWFSSLLLQRCDRVIVHSQWAKQNLLSLYTALKPEIVRIIPHGNLSHVNAGIDQKTAVKKIGISENRLTFLFFGSIKRFKGVDLLIDLIKDTVKNRQICHAIQFVIAGHPSSNELRALLTRKLEGFKNVHMDLRYIPDELEPYYFSAAHFVLLPYEQISQSGVLSSALGYGRPVLATNAGNFAEVLTENRAGLILPRTVSAWSQMIARLVDEPATVDELSARATIAQQKSISWTSIACKTHELYQLMLQEDNR